MSKIPQTYVKSTSDFTYQAIRTVNGNIEFGVNIKSTSFISQQAPGVANTEFTIDHNLGFVPNGFLVLSKDATCDVYSSRINQWTTSQIFLKCTVSSINLVLVVL